jgi:hypothetical protein
MLQINLNVLRILVDLQRYPRLLLQLSVSGLPASGNVLQINESERPSLRFLLQINRVLLQSPEVLLQVRAYLQHPSKGMLQISPGRALRSERRTLASPNLQHNPGKQIPAFRELQQKSGRLLQMDAGRSPAIPDLLQIERSETHEPRTVHR